MSSAFDLIIMSISELKPYHLRLNTAFHLLNHVNLRAEVDEPHHTVKPDQVVDNLAALVDILLS